MIKMQKKDHDVLSDFVPDLTPMLDILFILLVFFILTAGATFQALELSLPESVTEQQNIAAEQKHIMLEIRPEGYALDGKPIMTFDVLQNEISKTIKASPGHELIVAGDKNASLERLLHVLTYLQSQGIQAANILMKKEIAK
ncbi:MAG: biopolymer transporter ExbD [Methylocystaceae bacterium]|nr:biopolymer transporter ExbD [Methylocystaceae bacterium]